MRNFVEQVENLDFGFYHILPPFLSGGKEDQDQGQYNLGGRKKFFQNKGHSAENPGTHARTKGVGCEFRGGASS